MHSESTPEWSGSDSMRRAMPLLQAVRRINAYYKQTSHEKLMKGKRVRWIPLPMDKLNRRADPVDDFLDTVPAVRVVEPEPPPRKIPWYGYLLDFDSVVLILFFYWVAYLCIRVGM